MAVAVFVIETVLEIVVVEVADAVFDNDTNILSVLVAEPEFVAERSFVLVSETVAEDV